ncbi:class I SAM-dependent methyltransferase [Pyrobaculum aerophilum]|uniref:class I SAM-dependent methyltransferase n=1 Tax=Pyrobaculum aerophilum TaxID=13773 RepID=UPI00216142BD|nr:class I SAM-dependent methyltransferase [Pyrobaculum aerophilum]
MYVDFPSVWRYFKDYISASGGIFELKKALDWSVWYAAKWWREVREAGAANLKNPFVKALYTALRTRGIIDDEGRVKKEVSRPEMPKGLYAREWVEMHKNFDEIGAVKVAKDEADRNALDLFYSDIQIQGWHRIMVKAFLKAAGFTDGLRVLEPYSREGQVAVLIHDEYKPAAYLGYDPNPDYVQVAKSMAPTAQFTAAPTACHLTGTYDVAILVEKMQWMADPLNELECIKKLLKRPGGLLLVAQPVAESMPGYLAILSAIGARQVYT